MIFPSERYLFSVRVLLIFSIAADDSELGDLGGGVGWGGGEPIIQISSKP